MCQCPETHLGPNCEIGKNYFFSLICLCVYLRTVILIKQILSLLYYYLIFTIGIRDDYTGNTIILLVINEKKKLFN